MTDSFESTITISIQITLFNKLVLTSLTYMPFTIIGIYKFYNDVYDRDPF